MADVRAWSSRRRGRLPRGRRRLTGHLEPLLSSRSITERMFEQSRTPGNRIDGSIPRRERNGSARSTAR